MKRILILISLIILIGCSNKTEIKTGKITCEQKIYWWKKKIQL